MKNNNFELCVFNDKSTTPDTDIIGRGIMPLSELIDNNILDK